MSAEKKPFWVKCTACSHCWPAAYAPMEADVFLRICLNNSKNCPKCGAPKPVVAKQKSGDLLEEVTA